MGFIGKKFASGFKVRFYSKEDDGRLKYYFYIILSFNEYSITANIFSKANILSLSGNKLFARAELFLQNPKN